MRNAPFRRSATRVAFAVLAACLAVAPATAADLLQVYRGALGNDQQFAAARATAQAGREKLPQALERVGLQAGQQGIHGADYRCGVDRLEQQ